MMKKLFCLSCEARATLYDQMGNPWCDADKVRHDLINWGKEHNWPLVECTAREETVNIAKSRYRFYAAGPGYDLWSTACILGSDHFMGTLSATVFGTGQEEI